MKNMNVREVPATKKGKTSTQHDVDDGPAKMQPTPSTADGVKPANVAKCAPNAKEEVKNWAGASEKDRDGKEAATNSQLMVPECLQKRTGLKKSGPGAAISSPSESSTQSFSKRVEQVKKKMTQQKLMEAFDSQISTSLDDNKDEKTEKDKKADTEKNLVRMQKVQPKDPEKKLASMAKVHADDPEKKLASMVKVHADDPEKKLASMVKVHADDPEKKLASMVKVHADDPEKQHASMAKLPAAETTSSEEGNEGVREAAPDHDPEAAESTPMIEEKTPKQSTLCKYITIAVCASALLGLLVLFVLIFWFNIFN